MKLRLCTSVGIITLPTKSKRWEYGPWQKRANRELGHSWYSCISCHGCSRKMIASASILRIRNTICIANSINLIVKKSCDHITTQDQRPKEVIVSISGVFKNWSNSTYCPRWWCNWRKTLSVLEPINQATVKLSKEKIISGSKIIPMLKMLHHALQRNTSHIITTKLTENIRSRLTDTICMAES